MNYFNKLQESEGAVTPSIPRTSSTADFSKLCKRPHFQSHAHSFPPSVELTRSEDYDSENSQILYMKAPEKPNRSDRPLSSIDNGSENVMDGSTDTKPSAEDGSALDEASWDIIDREIFEWQYVCQTGRPFWWSPESKHTRLKRFQPRLSNAPSPHIWMRGIIDERSKPAYDRQRRVVSDSYLSDPTKAHDLAEVIAIQLLGSCFTLPPDYVIGAPSPNYTIFDKDGATLLDPRLISSLRMHTHFRYSPCFGHQARNTSPVQLWPGTYDGPSPNSSPSPFDTGLQTPYIHTSESSHRRKREHQILHVTEDSRSEHSLDIDTDGHSRAEAELVRPATGNKRRSVTDASNRTQHRRSRNQRYRPPGTPPPSAADADNGIGGDYRGVQSCQAPRINYRLQPVIRSEPHPVYVQPVKELVVKRWKTFRRRFGGSLNAPLPSEDESQMSESGYSSSAMSCDGKERRRRARERGEIHSSSIDDTAHYNTPASGDLSPNRSQPATPYWVDSGNATPQFELADPLAAAAALVAAESRSAPSQSQHATPMIPKNNPVTLPETPSGGQTPCNSTVSSATSGNIPPKAGTAFFNPLKQPSPSSAHSFSAKKQSRQRRKSMLSEVCTPEGLRHNIAEGGDTEAVDKSILSVMGSALASPQEEPEPISPLRLPRQFLDTFSSPGPVGSIGETLAVERPRMTRTSTSGSQIFTPSTDGVELDGLPVGPSKDLWTQKGNRRERTYL